MIQKAIHNFSDVQSASCYYNVNPTRLVNPRFGSVFGCFYVCAINGSPDDRETTVPQVINGGIACFETAWVVGRSRRAGDCLSAINANATSADRSARLIINRTGIGRWAASFTDARWNQALTPPHVRRSESRHHPLDIVPWTYFLAHSPSGQFASIFMWCTTFPPFHHHPPIYSIQRSSINVYKIDSGRSVRVRVSNIYISIHHNVIERT